LHPSKGGQFCEPLCTWGSAEISSTTTRAASAKPCGKELVVARPQLFFAGLLCSLIVEGILMESRKNHPKVLLGRRADSHPGLAGRLRGNNENPRIHRDPGVCEGGGFFCFNYPRSYREKLRLSVPKGGIFRGIR
jgi:hypothetical protein